MVKDATDPFCVVPGYEKFYKIGYDEGYEVGHEEGVREATPEDLADLLAILESRKGAILNSPYDMSILTSFMTEHFNLVAR